MYVLQNSKVTGSELQLSFTSTVAVVEQSETTMGLSSDVSVYPKDRLGLDAQQDSPIGTPMVENILIDLV